MVLPSANRKQSKLLPTLAAGHPTLPFTRVTPLPRKEQISHNSSMKHHRSNDDDTQFQGQSQFESSLVLQVVRGFPCGLSSA